MIAVLTALSLTVAACGATQSQPASPQQTHESGSLATGQLPGMPAQLDPNDVYTADRPGKLSRAVSGVPERVYVPNAESNNVDVIDPRTFRVIDRYPVGKQPQHVVPSYDLKTLWAANDKGNSLTPIDPISGKPSGPAVPVQDPYNMYFTPDGRSAVVVAEQLRRLDFHDPHTMAVQKSVPVPCRGIDHADFAANGRYALFSCEFSAAIVKVDIAAKQLVGVMQLGHDDSPQDVKLSPDGRTFYVADMHAAGVHLIDGDNLTEKGFIPTGPDAHGLYVSRDSKELFVTNRQGGGSVSVIPFALNRVTQTWRIPGGGSPDMGNLSVDGKELWLSGRYNQEVYAFDTQTGRLLARIKVGRQPHGLTLWPQPGRYSTGHTGVMR